MLTLLLEVGTAEQDQFAAVFQSVLVPPTHVFVALNVNVDVPVIVHPFDPVAVAV